MIISELIRNGHPLDSIMNYTVEQVQLFYKYIPSGMDKKEKADMAEAVMVGNFPGKKGKQALNYIAGLRNG